MGRLKRLSGGAKVLVAVCLGGAVFGIVSAVQAAIPDSNGVIHGCYQYTQTNNNGGALRVIDTDKNQICRKLEKPLNWNQTGPTGPTGPTGATGVVALYAISGQPDDPIASGAAFPDPLPGGWAFEGPTATVTVTDTQSIVASIGASLGRRVIVPGAPPNTSSTPNGHLAPPGEEFGFGVCFQNTGGGDVVNMNQFSGGNPNNWAVGQYEFTENDYTGLGAVTPGAGTYNVGYCVQNYGDEALDNNNWANGYVEVVDGTPNTSGVSQASRNPD